MAKLYLSDDSPELHEGEDISRSHMYVCANYVETESDLDGRSFAYADAVMNDGNRLARVEFSTEPKGTGFWVMQHMRVEDAANFPLGKEVTLHMRKGDRGYPEYFAITDGFFNKKEKEMKTGNTEEFFNELAVEFAKLKAENKQLIDLLTAEVTSAGEDLSSDIFYDITDELKGKLGSMAANLLEYTDEQDVAISRAENWVAENVANAGIEDGITAAIWLNGPELAATVIREGLDSSPKSSM